jgi:hypothetical protein
MWLPDALPSYRVAYMDRTGPMAQKRNALALDSAPMEEATFTILHYSRRRKPEFFHRGHVHFIYEFSL